MSNIQKIVVKSVIKLNPIMIKNLGDSNLMIFNKDEIELKLKSLYQLKQKIESYLQENGFSENTSFALHYGEITTGSIGIPPYENMDAFGNEINNAFYMLGKSSTDNFSISSQLYDCLGDELKAFHKDNLFN